MDSFKVYDLLPNGVIVFKNNKIAFINKHISDVMNLTDLTQENAVEIIAKTIGVNVSDELYSFFSERSFFIHREKTIQIAQNSFNEIDVFSFMLIDDSLICKDKKKTKKTKEKQKKEIKKSNIDAKVANFFKLNKIQKIKVLTFYKGLPLKNFAKVINLTKDFIEIKVDNKHLLSLLETDSILLLNNEDKNSSVLRAKVSKSDKNIFTVNDFSVSKESMNQREEIRVRPNGELNISVNDKLFNIYDISKKAIAVNADDPEDEEMLKKTGSIKLMFEDSTLNVDTKYLKSIQKDDGTFKIVFLLIPNEKATQKINSYVANRQNEIIREIHKHLELRNDID